MAESERFSRISSRLDCSACKVRRCSEWGILRGQDLSLLDRSKVVINYRPGESIYTQGCLCQGIYCIVRGTVALRKMDAMGHSILVRLAHAGQTLGHGDYFGGESHATSAESLTASTVCQIGRNTLRPLLEHNPTLWLKFLAHLADDLRRAEEAILSIAFLSVRTRLLHLLLALKNRYAGAQEEGTIVIALPMTRKDMAALLGTRPETIARTIHALESDGIAAFSGGTVVIPDLNALMSEIEPRKA